MIKSALTCGPVSVKRPLHAEWPTRAEEDDNGMTLYLGLLPGAAPINSPFTLAWSHSETYDCFHMKTKNALSVTMVRLSGFEQVCWLFFLGRKQKTLPPPPPHTHTQSCIQLLSSSFTPYKYRFFSISTTRT